MQNKLYRRISWACSAVFMLASVALPSWAQAGPARSSSPNRQTSDALFPEGRDSIVNQTLYTLGDVAAYYATSLVRDYGIPSEKDLKVEAQKQNLVNAAKAEVPEDQLINGIRQADLDLARAHVAEVKVMQKAGLIPWTIRQVGVVGNAAVIVDVLGRVWVWGPLDKNPTWSPAWQGLKFIGERLTPSGR